MIEISHPEGASDRSSDDAGCSVKRSRKSILLADAHVHIYDCFDLSRQLAAAYGHFQRIASKLATDVPFDGCLLLTESRGFNYYERLRPAVGTRRETDSAPGWVFHLTSEEESIRASGPNGESLYIVDGRQIVVAEGLEVLALCTNLRVDDGKGIRHVISAVTDAGGLATIPWGAGKWWFGRGQLVERVARAMPELCLGDNANRPGFMHPRRHFRLAADLGMPILPGSDPLPIIGEESRTGSFGFAALGKKAADSPAAKICEVVREHPNDVVPYGALETSGRFIANQFRINLQKRLPAFGGGR